MLLKTKYFHCLFLLFFYIIISQKSFAIERRKKLESDKTSYFIYPLIYKVPGLGSGEGAGATIVNLLGAGSTLSLLRIQGEIEVDSIIATGIPLFTKHLTLSAAYANGRKGGFAFYEQGPDSSEDPEFTLEFGPSWGRAFEFNLNFFDRQLEFYFGAALSYPEIDYEKSNLADFDKLENMTPEEQELGFATFMKNLLKYYQLTKIFVERSGLKIDLTDDRIDPRLGARFHYEQYGFEGEGMTNFIVEDYSLTGYIPIGNLSSVLVANIFYSKSEVTKALGVEVFEDHETCLKEVEGNEKISKETICRGLKRGVDEFNETEADNSSATSLGGPNRLRSYPISRFHDKYTFFAGLEYRYYFLEQSTPFDFILEKGVFEAAQLALFYEIGQVALEIDYLFENFKYSTGVGLRLVFSSVVLRADYAIGKEGEEMTVFIGYGF